MHALRVSLLVGILAVAVAAAGCGGSDDDSAAATSGSETSETTATDAWAEGVCSALTTWTTSIASAAASLGDGGGENALETAVEDVEAATRALGDDLDDLGTPDTEAGAEAKDSLKELADQLEDDIEGMQEAASDAEGASATLSAFSTISGTLVTMGTAVSSTFQEFEQLDAKGELSAAFSGADSCMDLTDGTS